MERTADLPLTADEKVEAARRAVDMMRVMFEQGSEMVDAIEGLLDDPGAAA